MDNFFFNKQQVICKYQLCINMAIKEKDNTELSLCKYKHAGNAYTVHGIIRNNI